MNFEKVTIEILKWPWRLALKCSLGRGHVSKAKTSVHLRNVHFFYHFLLCTTEGCVTIVIHVFELTLLNTVYKLINRNTADPKSYVGGRLDLWMWSVTQIKKWEICRMSEFWYVYRLWCVPTHLRPENECMWRYLFAESKKDFEKNVGGPCRVWCTWWRLSLSLQVLLYGYSVETRCRVVSLFGSNQKFFVLVDRFSVYTNTAENGREKTGKKVITRNPTAWTDNSVNTFGGAYKIEVHKKSPNLK